MNRTVVPPALALLVALAVTACTLASPAPDGGVRWVSRKDGSPPDVADSSDCRAQARRQADLRFLPREMQVQLPSGQRSSATLPSDDPDRMPSEKRFYAQCMRQKGFQLVDTPP